MPANLKIDFVSDISCPWCAIGLRALQAALGNLRGSVEATLHFQPFELNPDMGPDGQNIGEHIAQKYGYSARQLDQAQEMIQSRGAQVGFEFNMQKRSRIYNTFDAHRLLHWAELEGRQLDLKQALLRAYFTDGANVSDHAVLATIAAEVGLDARQAAAILGSDRYAAEVRSAEHFYRTHGINAVPAVIINERHVIEGGQPVEVFEQALRRIAVSDPAV